MLKAVLMDDERPALDELSYLLREKSVEVIGTFQKPEGALDFIVKAKPDIVFLDIEMRGANGIDFGVALQDRTENTAVIFVTAHPEYALEAFRAYPLDYMVKPVEEERLEQTLSHLRNASVLRANAGKGILSVRCFGKFNILFGDQKVRLPTKKTRELLAYLLCNEENPIYRDDLTRIVFGSRDAEKDANNLRVSLFRIRNALREAGVKKDTFAIQDDFSIKIADGVCDFVDFMRFNKENRIVTTENIAAAEEVVGTVNGELFDDLDTPWIAERREWVMVQTEELLINLSIFYLSNGHSEQAEAALLRLLSLNPVSEQCYHLLLDLYMRTRGPLKFRFCYERYREMAKKEFDVRPSKIYTDYYDKCTSAM
ncbi:MAG: response regulator [Lawsonibacter sp.]|nr:response regulator [Lawsonibacter sp.]